MVSDRAVEDALAIIPGDDSLLKAVAEAIPQQTKIAVFDTANALLWHARRTRVDVVVFPLALPDMGGGDLVDILPLLLPSVRMVLCGDGPPELAHRLSTLGGQLVLGTAAPETRREQIYRALGLAPPPSLSPAVVERSSRSPQQGNRELAALPRATMRRLLALLLRESGARFVLLSDSAGMPIVELGDSTPLKSASLGPLLAPVMFTGSEFAHQLGDGGPRSLFLYEGERHNVYVTNVGNVGLLILVVEQADSARPPAPIRALLRRVADLLLERLLS
jgi:predicted regulator of Ras-like GTPase activity (Roadblock/LC7/MglB family)